MARLEEPSMKSWGGGSVNAGMMGSCCRSAPLTNQFVTAYYTVSV
jgi:hypothetical protein